MVNSFPLPSALIEGSEDFKRCSPTEKLYMFYILSELNLHQWQERKENYFKDDMSIAVTLNVKEDTIRRARRKFQKPGYIDVRPGFRNPATGQAVATTYLGSKWLDLVEKIKEANKEGPEDEGDKDPESGNNEKGRFSLIHRYTFYSMLDEMRKGRFDSYDTVTLVYIYYLRDKFKDKKEEVYKDEKYDFYITKKEFSDLTNMRASKLEECIINLYEKITFEDGSHYFEYEDLYHRWEFNNIVWLADPSDDDNNRSHYEAMKERLKAQIDKAKEDKQNEPGLKFISAYRWIYRQHMDKDIERYYGDAEQATELLEMFTAEQMKEMARWYITADRHELPASCQAKKNRTIRDFLNNVEVIFRELKDLAKSIK